MLAVCRRRRGWNCTSIEVQGFTWNNHHEWCKVIAQEGEFLCCLVCRFSTFSRCDCDVVRFQLLHQHCESSENLTTAQEIVIAQMEASDLRRRGIYEANA